MPFPRSTLRVVPTSHTKYRTLPSDPALEWNSFRLCDGFTSVSPKACSRALNHGRERYDTPMQFYVYKKKKEQVAMCCVTIVVRR